MPLDARHDELVPTYAEWVSTAALALSAAVAVHQVRTSRRDAPRVVLLPAFLSASQDRTVTVGLRVANDGPRPVTISAAGWEVRRHSTPDGSTAELGTDEPLGPALPHRLDSHDDVAWRWPPEFTGSLGIFDEFRPFVDVHGLRRPRRLLQLMPGRPSAGDHRHYAPGKEWLKPDLVVQMARVMEERQREPD